MGEWILIAVLYVLVIGLFRFLGGFGSAGEAFRQWGRASSTDRLDRCTSS
jgi:hypothetical protein